MRLGLAKSLFAQGGPGLLNPVQESAQSLPGRARVGSRMARSLLPQNLPLWAGELSLCITRERAGVKLNPSSPANTDCRCFRFGTVWVSILSSFFMLPFHKPYCKPFINPSQPTCRDFGEGAARLPRLSQVLYFLVFQPLNSRGPVWRRQTFLS